MVPFLTVFFGGLTLVAGLTLVLSLYEALLKNHAAYAAESPVNFQKTLEVAQDLDQKQEQQEREVFDANLALTDVYSRVSNDFEVPEKLKDRVRFWFDVYTKYGDHSHVIHHKLYPWIIFEVVDTTSFEQTKGPSWLRRQRGLDYAAKRKQRVSFLLKMLSHKRSFKHLSVAEQNIYDKLLAIPGSRHRVIVEALRSLRTQLGQKDFFIAGLQNSPKYLPYIESVFEKMNLPIELTRIPFVESSFNEVAYSKVGAVGVWQIMPSMGRKFSIVNENIDERYSPIKASEMAARILKENKLVLKNWPLAVTAYNNGTGNILKVSKLVKSKDLGTIIERYHKDSFQFASSNFYSSFLAVLHAERYHDILFQDLHLVKKEVMNHDVFQVTRKIKPAKLALLAEIDLQTLSDYNLDIKRAIRNNKFLPKGYRLHLPGKNRLILESKFGSKSANNASLPPEHI